MVVVQLLSNDTITIDHNTIRCLSLPRKLHNEPGSSKRRQFPQCESKFMNFQVKREDNITANGEYRVAGFMAQMEGFASKEPVKNLTEIEQLAGEKQSLEEELIQCKADKDFVWMLWKRLQTAKPDMASVISMVVAREKEKAEKKDQKILEILRLKDEKIMEMRERMDADKDEMKLNKERLHELLIENDELKQKLDERESELSGKMKEMENRTQEIEEKNQYLSQLVKAYQEEKEAKDKQLKENLEQIDNEKNGLTSQIKNLQSEIEKLHDDRTSLGEAMKTNAQLKEQIKEMESHLEELTTKSEDFCKQHDEAITALKVRESQLQEEKKASQFLSGEVKDKDKELIRLRADIAECRNAYDEALEQVREHTAVVERLQGMQDQVYQVMEDHKQSYEREITTIQKEMMDLRRRCTEYQCNEDRLRHDIGVLQQNKASDFEDIISKDRLIEDLQQRLDETSRAHSSPQKRARLDQSCQCCKDLEEKLETLEAEHEDLADVLREKTRRISSLEKVVKNSLSTKGTISSNKDSVLEASVRDERLGSKSDDTSTLRYKNSRYEKRIDDLKRLLELKDSELTEVRRGHNQRQQRYRMLKENYGLVRNQLKTFENEPVERTPPKRLSERALRHEDSDGVWNELTHYRGQYEKLNKERHDVLEELDVLRVEHAKDLTTIQELRLSLEEEKEGLLERIHEETDKKKSAQEKESTKTGLLQEEVSALRDIEQENKRQIQELEDEVLHLQQELKIVADDNASLKRNSVNLERQLHSASHEIEDRIEECEYLKVDLRDKERRLSRSPTRSPTKTTTNEDGDEFFKRQLKDIDMYDQQLKQIAKKILSPSQSQRTDTSSLHKEHQGTQTLEISRTADFSSFVDLDRSEDDREVGVVEVDARARAVDKKMSEKLNISHKVSSAQTPRGKKISTMKRTPGRGEWSSMRQRILSLTQQVAAIRGAKDKAVKALNDEKLMNENLRSELNIVLQRLQVSKNSVQTLTEDLRKCIKEKEEILVEKQNAEQDDNDTEIVRQKTEEKLKVSSNEVSRLTCLVKTLRGDKNVLKDKLADCQQRLRSVEKDIAQKKTFVEEMKNKLRKALDAEERYADTVKDLEEKIRRLTDRETQKKLQTDSLKRQLDAETREKEKFRQQYFLSLEEVKKKTRLLADSRSLLGHAEMAVSEMEAAATEQLQSLANKSEAALKCLRNKFDKAEGRIEEFQVLIKTLVDELLVDTERACLQITQIEEQLSKEELSKPSSRQARNVACSILNMTNDDLDDFMKQNDDKSGEQISRKQREKEWKNTIDVVLKKEVPFAIPLIEVLLDIIEGRKSLEGRLHQLTNRST